MWLRLLRTELCSIVDRHSACLPRGELPIAFGCDTGYKLGTPHDTHNGGAP